HVVGEVLFTARRRGRPSEGGVRRGEGFASQRTRALDQPAAGCKEGLTARVRDGCDFATLQPVGALPDGEFSGMPWLSGRLIRRRSGAKAGSITIQSTGHGAMQS